MAERVQAYDAEGNLGSVDAKDADALVRSGGRIATPEDLAKIKADADYAKQSTAMKVATAGSMIAPVTWPVHLALRAAGGTLPPEVESYKEGVSSGLTGGLASVGMKEAIEAVGGKAAAHAYGQNALATAKAYRGMHSAGVAAGLVGGAVATPGAGSAAAKLMPGMVAEAKVAGALGRVLGRGTLSRAAIAGGSMAARGAVEGALLAGAEEFSEQSLGDHDLAGQKIMIAAGTGFLYGAAGGAVLGAGGSLAASGARGTARAVGRGLGRFQRRLGGVAEGATAEARAVAGAVDDLAAGEARAAAVPGAKPSIFSPDGMTSRALDAAAELEVKSLGGTKATIKRVLPGKDGGINTTKLRELGAWMRDEVSRPMAKESSLFGTMMRATAEERLPIIQQLKGQYFDQIGEIVERNNRRIDFKDIMDMAGDRYATMRRDYAMSPNADTFLTRWEKLVATAERNGDVVIKRDPVSGAIISAEGDAAAIYRMRAKAEGVAYEMRQQGAGSALKQFKGHMRDIDDHLVKQMPDSAEIKALKRKAHMASLAEDIAEDGVARAVGNNNVSPRDALAGNAGATAGAVAGAAIGGAPGAFIGAKLGGVGYTLGSKLLRERGAAMGAFALTRAAEGGHVARLVARADEAIGRAARGVVDPPKLPSGGGGGYRTNAAPGNVRVAAARAAERARSVAADPEAVMDRAARHTEAMSTVAPNVTNSYVAASVRAAAFLQSKIPHHYDPDPLDPHPRPQMTDAEAASFLQTAAYVEDPEKFFREAARGKITPEGVEVARELMPGAFAELQERTIAAIADYHASNRIIPYQRRERLGLLLDIPLVPSQVPGHRAFLQRNLAPQQQSAQAPSRKPLSVSTPKSPLDRIEGGRNGTS